MLATSNFLERPSSYNKQGINKIIFYIDKVIFKFEITKLQIIMTIHFRSLRACLVSTVSRYLEKFHF